VSVYVDGSREKIGSAVMSRLAADTRAELEAMASAIGAGYLRVAEGTPREHWLVTQQQKQAAIRAGAAHVVSGHVDALFADRKRTADGRKYFGHRHGENR
jgi:hypothetical protein